MRHCPRTCASEPRVPRSRASKLRRCEVPQCLEPEANARRLIGALTGTRSRPVTICSVQIWKPFFSSPLVLRVFCQECHALGHDRFAAADRTDLLSGLGFNTDAIGRNVEQFGQPLPHGVFVGR